MRSVEGSELLVGFFCYRLGDAVVLELKMTRNEFKFVVLEIGNDVRRSTQEKIREDQSDRLLSGL